MVVLGMIALRKTLVRMHVLFNEPVYKSATEDNAYVDNEIYV
jgi:hypothetical protein